MYSNSFSSDSSSSDIYFKKFKNNDIFNDFNAFVSKVLYSSSNVTYEIIFIFLRSMKLDFDNIPTGKISLYTINLFLISSKLIGVSLRFSPLLI